MATSGKTENSMIGYDYDLEKGDFDGDYIFTLTKRVDFTSDDTIKVTIEFPTVIDKNEYEKKANGDFLYNDGNRQKALQFIKDRARQFIEKLIHNSTKKGGQKKKQRKTKKNRKNKN